MQNIEPDVFSQMLHVAVAVIVKRDHVLISKRADQVHQGGLWEFPGGKVEKSETVAEALSREIQEELGLTIKASLPLIKLVHHYPDKSVLLETRLITAFEGREYAFPDKSLAEEEKLGMEKQVVKWVKLEQLNSYQFPEANKAIINAIRLPERYLISPDCYSENSEPEGIEHYLQQFAESISHHPLVQLRIKSLHGDKLYEVVKQALNIAQEKQTCVLVNSALFKSPGIMNDAINQHIGGIHLTGYHLHEKKLVENFRSQFPEKIIAASCHCKEDVERANLLALDFIVISPVQQTASHPQQTSLGWEGFALLTDLARIPVFALGGMSQKDIIQAKNYGAQGIAAIRSLWGKKWKED